MKTKIRNLVVWCVKHLVVFLTATLVPATIALSLGMNVWVVLSKIGKPEEFVQKVVLELGLISVLSIYSVLVSSPILSRVYKIKFEVALEIMIKGAFLFITQGIIAFVLEKFGYFELFKMLFS